MPAAATPLPARVPEWSDIALADLAHLEAEGLALLSDLIRIPSVKGVAAPGAPFGIETRRVLDRFLAEGAAHGFRTAHLDGMAGYVEFGEGPGLVAVLCHLDVVPAGDGWTGNPFEPVVGEGAIVGRGSLDDKGPAAAAYLAMRFLKDAGVGHRTRFRLILGLDEESGSTCMERYRISEETPDWAFTPDAVFPVIHAEKGILQCRIRRSRDPASPSSERLPRAEGGSRPNMVPGACRLLFRVRGNETDASAASLARLAEARAIPLRLATAKSEPEPSGRTGTCLSAEVLGVMAHASLPELGENAVSRALVLAQAWLAGQGIEDGFLDAFCRLFSTGIDGRGVGIASRDDLSGPLTLNVGRLELTPEEAVLDLDIRYPVTLSEQDILDRLLPSLASEGFVFARLGGHDPIRFGEDHPLVAALMEVYRATCDPGARPVAIGGGTYARSMPNTVAFGPLFPGEAETAHQAGESLARDTFRRCVHLYARALLRLASLPSKGSGSGGNSPSIR